MSSPIDFVFQVIVAPFEMIASVGHWGKWEWALFVGGILTVVIAAATGAWATTFLIVAMIAILTGIGVYIKRRMDETPYKPKKFGGSDDLAAPQLQNDANNDEENNSIQTPEFKDPDSSDYEPYSDDD